MYIYIYICIYIYIYIMNDITFTVVVWEHYQYIMYIIRFWDTYFWYPQDVFRSKILWRSMMSTSTMSWEFKPYFEEWRERWLPQRVYSQQKKGNQLQLESEFLIHMIVYDKCKHVENTILVLVPGSRDLCLRISPLWMSRVDLSIAQWTGPWSTLTMDNELDINGTWLD